MARVFEVGILPRRVVPSPPPRTGTHAFSNSKVASAVGSLIQAGETLKSIKKTETLISRDVIKLLSPHSFQVYNILKLNVHMYN